MEELLMQVFGTMPLTMSIWLFLGAVLIAFIVGVRVTWAVMYEFPRIRGRMKRTDEIDKEQQQAIDELQRAVTAINDENKTIESRVSAVSSILTSVTARRVL